MESLTKRFEQRIAEFLRHTQLTPTEFGERAIGDRKFCGDLRRGRSPRLVTVDRVLAFMEAYDRARHGTRGSAGSESLGDSSSKKGVTPAVGWIESEVDERTRRQIVASRADAE